MEGPFMQAKSLEMSPSAWQSQNQASTVWYMSTCTHLFGFRETTHKILWSYTSPYLVRGSGCHMFIVLFLLVFSVFSNGAMLRKCQYLSETPMGNSISAQVTNQYTACALSFWKQEGACKMIPTARFLGSLFCCYIYTRVFLVHSLRSSIYSKWC